jgi:hypothetical protein
MSVPKRRLDQSGKMPQKQIKGYVIYCPHTEGYYSYSTFGLTAYEAWVRYYGTQHDDKDISRKIQAWHDRGYRVREATLTIHPGDDELEPQGNPSIQPNNRNDQRIT